MWDLLDRDGDNGKKALDLSSLFWKAKEQRGERRELQTIQRPLLTML
jgi:hypothetical protein